MRYHSERTSNKYKNIQERMPEVTKALASFRPTKENNQTVKTQHNYRLGKLWEEFEARSDSWPRCWSSRWVEQEVGAGEAGGGEQGEAVGGEQGEGGGGDQGSQGSSPLEQEAGAAASPAGQDPSLVWMIG